MSGPDVKVEAQPVLPLPSPEWEIDAKPLFRDSSPSPDLPPTLTPKKPAMGHEDVRKPKTGRKKSAPVSVKPALVEHLPLAWEDAHETFDELERCVYERKDLGLSREQDEMMVCDCVFDKHDPDAEPCGSHSDCINRAILIECLADECRARSQCRNQRFTKRQYAPIEIVLTEMKGYGLRAAGDIPAGSLIYEYIGEVVAEKTFRKRIQQYADEGIRHFYFMMLQKEEYIDATKKGGIGRFANHSCSPNSEVQKWVVGRRLRMGIFSKRDVVKGEEITFNYNVDRYGYEAQPCYCGEPNCVGSIGGKTQTDIGGMNDLFLEALGITDEVEAMEMKGSKKKKSRQLDEDFTPVLRPIMEHQTQKVAAAMRQSMENTKMMSKLLERINMTEEAYVHRQLMRMHGFSLMSMVLTELVAERDIVLLALGSMIKWKLQIRNKIEDSNIEEPVKLLCDSPDDIIGGLAKQLLQYWSTLELSYKIPRVSKIASLDAEDEAATTTIAEANSCAPDHRRPQAWENTTEVQLDIAPIRLRPPPTFSRPRPPPPPPPKPSLSQSISSAADRFKLDAIIALAQQTVAAAASVPSASDSPAPSAAAESSRSGSRTIEDERDRKREELDRRKRQKRAHPEDDEAKKEKRLTKVVGDVVVRSMSKYKDQMEHDTFKRYAKECTMVLVEKEKKGQSYGSTRHPSLSDEKKAKMKAFTKEYAHKLLKKLKEKGKIRKGVPSVKSNGFASTPMAVSTSSRALEDTPNGHDALLDEMFGQADGDGDGEEDEDPLPPDIATPDVDADGSIVASHVFERKANGGYVVDLGSTPGSEERD